MKAIDYINKYGEDLKSSDTEIRNKAAQSILADMMMEASEIIKARNIKKASSAISVIKELNQKWNAIASKVGILAHDGFKNIWIHEFPEYSGLF